MKVFLAWSGDASHILADGLRTWLPRVIQGIKPFLSSRDIRSGSRWNEEIGGELQDTNYGILCLTRQNLDAIWIHFEAGALSKAVHRSHVVPLLLDVDAAQLQRPISEFQSKQANNDDLRALVIDINNSTETPLDEQLLLETYEMWWPQLDEVLEAARAAIGHDDAEETPRSSEEITGEILELSRSISRGVAGLKRGFDRQNRLEHFEGMPRGKIYGRPGGALRQAATVLSPSLMDVIAPRAEPEPDESGTNEDVDHHPNDGDADDESQT